MLIICIRGQNHPSKLTFELPVSQGRLLDFRHKTLRMKERLDNAHADINYSLNFEENSSNLCLTHNE